MKLLITFLFLSVLASCTITKRVHNNGWHIEWRNPHNRTTPISNNDSKGDLLPNNQPYLSNQDLSHQEDSIIYTDVYPLDTREVMTTSLKNKEEGDFDGKNNEDPVRITKENIPLNVQQDETNTANLENESQRQEPLGVVSILLSSAAILLFIHICLLLTDNGWVALFGMSYAGLFLLAIALAVTALILAIKSLQKIHKSPTTLKGSKLAWTGIGMSIGANGLILILLVGIGLYYLFENFFGF